MKILVIDNYDSFTYNLVQYIERIPGTEVTVARNDKIGLEEVGGYEKIVISPGPGVPDEAGISKQLIERYGPEKSILGVCLGHQAIAEVFGGTIRNLAKVYHGVSSVMLKNVDHDYLLRGLPREFDAGRYHSWIVEDKTLPGCLEVTVRNTEGAIMALRHKDYDVRGVQFHPESVLTEYGGMIIKNWIDGAQMK
jgi:anthranilate synthase component II